MYGGAVLLKISKEGISVANIPRQNPCQYKWRSISKVVLTEKYIHIYKWLPLNRKVRINYRTEKDLNKLT